LASKTFALHLSTNKVMAKTAKNLEKSKIYLIKNVIFLSFATGGEICPGP